MGRSRILFWRGWEGVEGGFCGEAGRLLVSFCPCGGRMLRRRLEEAGFTRAEPRVRSGAAEKGGSQHAGPLSKAEQRGGGSGCWSEGGREGWLSLGGLWGGGERPTPGGLLCWAWGRARLSLLGLLPRAGGGASPPPGGCFFSSARVLLLLLLLLRRGSGQAHGVLRLVTSRRPL